MKHLDDSEPSVPEGVCVCDIDWKRKVIASRNCPIHRKKEEEPEDQGEDPLGGVPV